MKYKNKRKNKKIFIVIYLLLIFGFIGILTKSIYNDDSTLQDKVYINDLKISILGDSISTLEGISDNSTINATLGSNQSRYYANDISYEETEATLQLNSWKETYWGTIIEDLELDLVVNNSWRGTSVSTVRGASSCTSGTRATQLHSYDGKTPDIIVIYIGTNDYTSSADVGDYSSVEDIYDGSNYIGDTSTFSEAYATMVHKIKNKYKKADIYLCNLIYGTSLGISYNNAIDLIAKEYDCNVVDFSQLVSTWNWTNHCMDGLHPNADGFKLMADILKDKLLDNYSYKK